MDSAIIFLFVSIIVIGIALIVMISLTKRSSRVLDKSHYQQKWLSIEQSVKDDHASMQIAIIQADKLLDKALQQRGFAGQTMGERMKVATKSNHFSEVQAVWAAHKLRNRIAHEDDVSVDGHLTRRVLQSFKRALRDIGAL